MGVVELEQLALQRGLVSCADAKRCGLSRMAFARFRRRLGCRKVLPKVYAPAKAAVDRLSALRAACLWAPGAVVSHRSALWLWELTDVAPARVELTIAKKRSPRCREVLVHRSEQLAESDRVRCSGIPVTSVLRTVLDAAKFLSEDELAEVLEKAIRRKLVSAGAVARRLRAGLQGWRGIHALKRLWRQHVSRGAVLDSVLELRFWRLLKRERVQLPLAQVPFRDDEAHDGRVDFLFAKKRLVVECLGKANHQDFEREALRNSRLGALGYRVLHVTWKMVERTPKALVARVRRALSFRNRRDVIIEAYERGEREWRRAERAAARAATQAKRG